MILGLSIVTLLVALLPCVLYFRNVRLFRPPPTVDSSDNVSELPAISVLIPARNEEHGIARCIESVLSSTSISLECVVLDDQSTDRTAAIVSEMALKDTRVRLESAPSLPPDWSGKQHACYQLAQQARYPVLAFLDADVRLTPDALHRILLFQRQSGAELVSGFPRQETGTLFEKLLIPLMHFLLLGFLPFDQMRLDRRASLGAGCGQLFLTTRDAYFAVGGHAHRLVKTSFHDGITLPRAYRSEGKTSDLCDITSLYHCRMYRSALQVWNGLAKNAREGLGAPRLLIFTSLLLLVGQTLPFLLTALAIGEGNSLAATLASVAAVLALAPRLDAAWRFQQSWLGAVLHPLAIALLVLIQWYANGRAWLGFPIGWKGRRPGVAAEVS